MFKTFLHTIINQWRRIFNDEGVILIMVAAPIIYATIYSLTYGTQVLRNIPIGVIDHSHTSHSRSLIQEMDAGANIYIAYEPCDMKEAKKLFFERKIYGIVYIPASFDTKLLRGEQATLSLYLDASYMLMYRQLFQELAALISAQNASLEFSSLSSEDINPEQAQAITTPVKHDSHILFNPYLGYGTFLMPSVIILILQQTLLIGAGMIAGTDNKKQKVTSQTHSPLGFIMGKIAAYTSIYTIITLYLIKIHFKLFHYPCNGAGLDMAIFLGIYLVACSLMAVAVAQLFSQRETSLMMLLWSSIPLLLLSGVSYPIEAMPKALQWLSWLFPSTHGIKGFTKIQMAEASLQEVGHEITALLWLGGIYFTIAYIYELHKKSYHHQTFNKLKI